MSAIRWALGLRPEDSPWSLALYVGVATALGAVWTWVVFWIPATSELLMGASAREQAEVLRHGSTMVLASCLVSVLFRRLILQMWPVFIVPVAAFLMWLGAVCALWGHLLFSFATDAQSGTPTAGEIVVLVPVLGWMISMHGWFITVPLAVFSVLALRTTSRTRVESHATSLPRA